MLLSQGKRERARALLAELDAIAGTRADEVDAGELPGLVRIALALGDTALAASLAEGVEPLTPLHQHALAACRAQLAEAAGDHADAARLHAEAAERWRGFGNVPERAYALLGQGRCLRALDDPAAERLLAEARELFRSIGYKPALTETEALLAQSQAAAS